MARTPENRTRGEAGRTRGGGGRSCRGRRGGGTCSGGFAGRTKEADAEPSAVGGDGDELASTGDFVVSSTEPLSVRLKDRFRRVLPIHCAVDGDGDGAEAAEIDRRRPESKGIIGL